MIISESSVYFDGSGHFVSRGGGASCVHNMAKSLMKSGNLVSVFCLKEFDEQKEQELIDGIDYIRQFSSDRSSFKLFKFLYLAKKFSKGFDIVFFNQFLPHLLLPFIRKAKKIAIIHDVYLDNRLFWFKQFGVFKGLVGLFVEILQIFFDNFFSDRIVTVSKSSVNKLMKLSRKSLLKKIFLIPNSINLSDYYISKKEKFILFVGRFVAYKRPFDLIDVLCKINEKYPDFSAKLVMTRNFPEIVEQVKLRAKQLNVDNFELIDYVSDEKLKELFSKAYILVHPSLIEGQGIVLLEALASNTPVCAYDLDAYENVLISGQNSELASPANVEELALNAVKIIENYKYYQGNTKNVLKDFSLDRFDEKMSKLVDFANLIK